MTGIVIEGCPCCARKDGEVSKSVPGTAGDTLLTKADALQSHRCVRRGAGTHLLMGTNEYKRSAPGWLGRPWEQLPTMRTTLSGFLPRRACAAMGLNAPMASTSTLLVNDTCTATVPQSTSICAQLERFPVRASRKPINMISAYVAGYAWLMALALPIA